MRKQGKAYSIAIVVSVVAKDSNFFSFSLLGRRRRRCCHILRLIPFVMLLIMLH